MKAKLNEFEKRFAEIRYLKDASSAVERFTPSEVSAWIAEKARETETDFAYPYRDALKTFPRAWWIDALNKIRCERPDTEGAQNFIRAIDELEPAYFADAPAQSIGWDLGLARTMRLLQSSAHAGVAALATMVRDSGDIHRWKAAGYLLLLDRLQTSFVEEELARLPEADANMAAWKLEPFGYERREGHLHRLWPGNAYHLSFSPDYLQGFRGRAFDSWAKPAPSDLPTMIFGGKIDGAKQSDGVALHHVLTLDPVPADLGISLSRLVLATRLDVFDGSGHFFRHGTDGSIVSDAPPHGADDWWPAELIADESYEYPALAETRVTLGSVAPIQQFQTWEESNGKENLFRLGGFPVFVQSPEYPACIGCSRAMMHLLSIDSGLPLSKPGPNSTSQFDWGSGGVANVYWCDACRVSAWTWHCT